MGTSDTFLDSTAHTKLLNLIKACIDYTTNLQFYWGAKGKNANHPPSVQVYISLQPQHLTVFRSQQPALIVFLKLFILKLNYNHIYLLLSIILEDMVLYFKARPELGDYTIFMGIDKNENEELIKYGFPEDIW